MHFLYSGSMVFKSPPLQKQIEDFVRNRIATGEFGQGSRLPSVNSLAKQTGVSVSTVQNALACLSREGLLDRKPRRPTYVRGTAPALTCAGIYFSRPLTSSNLGFYQILGQELQRKLGLQGVRTQIWSDDRAKDAQVNPLPSLMLAIRRREIQAIIAPLIYENDVKWLCEMAIPSSMLVIGSSVKNGVGNNFTEMLGLGMKQLREQGCRTVGVISNILLNPEGLREAEREIYGSLIEAISGAGLETRNDWIRGPADDPPHYAQYGYEQFHALWNLKRRPDGLLVFPDRAASGVVTAILERRVSVPGDLKLILHANDLLPYPCPLPAAFLVTKVGECADALISIVRRQFDGLESHPLSVSTPVVFGTNPFSSDHKRPA